MIHYSKIFRLIFFLCVYNLTFSHLYAQSIGISAGVNYTQISQLDFNKEVNITAYQLSRLNPKISLMLNFEYPLTSKFRLRSEIGYYGYGYTLSQDFGYNSYWANSIHFSNLQFALLADMTLFKIGDIGYLAIHGGLGGNYVVPALIRFGIFSKRSRSNNTSSPTTFTSIAGQPFERNKTNNITLIGGMNINLNAGKGKFFMGFNYNRALQPSPQLDMKFVLFDNGQISTYDDSLSPQIHFLNIYMGYAWFLRQKK